MAEPFLSIIIPAHNEELRIPATLTQTFEFLKEQAYSSEVIVVENASSDRTFAVLEGFARENPALRVVVEPNKGKGQAVSRGIREARGDYLFICDADLSMPIREVNRFLPPQLDGVDIAIASREAPGAVRYDEPAYRHIIGRIFNSMVRLIVLPGLQDTQCGFKCFRRDVAREIFPYQTISGWGFDVEILFVARRKGYRIVEVPIPWYYNPDSHIRVFRDSFQMAKDLLSIRVNALRGRYDAQV